MSKRKTKRYKRWLKRKEEQEQREALELKREQELNRLIEQQKKELRFDTNHSFYGINEKIR